MDIARLLALAAAGAALAMLLASGPGTRLGLWSWQVALSMLRWATYAAFAAGALALVLLALSALAGFRAGAGTSALALALSLAAAAPPVLLMRKAKSVPPIHDITTDTAEPPAFVALLPERTKAPNGAEYAGAEIAAQQQKAYPDLKSLSLKSPPREAVQRAADAARSFGWEIVATDPEGGRVEATATTGWFGFRDDVVVRVRPDGGGSRVDIRSMSRVGRSDIGANAARIREFLAKLS
jgi:uncharacterized protein (DUF1499 family)